MAAANVVARPPLPGPAAANNSNNNNNQQHKPRASGSWDDLLRNKGQDKAQQARARAAQSGDMSMSMSMSRRPYSNGVDWRPTSQSPPQQQSPYSQQQQQQQPVRARMELHHPHQRSSQAFAAHVAALSGNPSPSSSPLSREVTLGPEFDVAGGHPEYGIMPPEINHYSLNNGFKNRRSQTYPLPGQQGMAQSQGQAPQKQRPGMYARPRRLSGGGGSAPPAPRPGSFHSFDDAQGRGVRAASWGGMPIIEEAQAFETFPPPAARYQQHAYRSSAPAVPVWRRPEPIKQTAAAIASAAAAPRRPAGPDELFGRLPVEVLRLVLGYARALHLEGGSSSCATCWMRDCCSVALCNRRLLAVAREALYSDIQLVGKDGAQMAKRNKGLQAPRLVLLRRTLRANRSLGAVVRSLKVPALPDGAALEAGRYHDVVASVVMACPNLERLDGFYPSYRHGSENHLLHALETRRRLKEMTWVIEATPEGPSSAESGRAGKKASQSRKRQSRWGTAPAPAPAPTNDSTPDLAQQLAAAHATRFVMRHENWKELTHLTIHCVPGAGLSPDGATVGAVLALLPGIDSLYLSHLPASSFGDESLLRLPRALKKLGIAHCPGVTTAGLAAFAARSHAAGSLETLTLIHQGVDSVDALVRVLARLDRLDTLSVVQAAAPSVGDDTFLFMPYLASRSLRRLHWDVQESSAGGGATRADDILSRSIAAGGFPRLRSVRAPNDPDGLFQGVCKPRERADLPGDRYRNTGLVSQATTSAVANNNSYSKSTTNLADDPGARSSSDTKDSGKELRMLPPREYGSDLHAARLAAQGRLEAARRFPRFEANVVDESGEVLSSEGLAGFIGDAASRIQYCLVPDEGATDARGGLAVMDDLLGDGGEDLLRRGDVSSNAGGGFGTGVAPCCVVPGQQSESAPSRGRLIKRDSGGKSSKEKEKERERERERERDEDTGRAREGCTGRWNSYNSEGLVDKKSASGDRWWHVERGRWRGRVELS